MNLFYKIDDTQTSVFTTQNSVVAWEQILSKTQSRTLAGYRVWFNEDVYDTVDWTTPPIKTIAELEEDHARYLRNKYEYVRVMFSGGSDSSSIVAAFLRVGLKIDEIATYTNASIRPDIPCGPEYHIHRYNWLKELYARYNTELPKITVSEIGEREIQSHFVKNYFYNHMGYTGSGSFSYNQLGEISQHFAPPATKNYCIVYGMEKPKLVVEDSVIYFTQLDKILFHGYSEKHPIEWFYLNRTTPDLIRAQIWNIINFAKLHHTNRVGEFITDLQSRGDHYHLWCMLLGRVTPEYINLASLLDKSDSSREANLRIYKHVDQYQSENNQAWKHYQEFINTLKDISQELFNKREVLPGMWTKKYLVYDTKENTK